MHGLIKLSKLAETKTAVKCCAAKIFVLHTCVDL